MKITLSILFFTLLLFINDIKAIWLPSQDMTWNYVLGNDIDVNSEKANVVDIDIRKSETKIKNLQKKGIKVICYFSVGTLESFRDDYPQFIAVKGLVQNTYDAWPDERWLDFRVEGIKPLLKNRMKLAVSKNCDAIEVDNLDGYQMNEVKSWPNPLTKKDTIVFAKWLSTTAHSLGLSIGLKNVPSLIDELSSYYDFAINEECIKYNECYLYKNFLKSGKAVFGVTYYGLAENKTQLCKNLDGLGISMIIKSGKKLEQSGIVFKGEKYCGVNFNSAVNTCFSIPLGYPCCTSTKEVVDTNEYGTWGVENGDWCGLKKASSSKNSATREVDTSSSSSGSSSSCFSKSLGFPCCSSKNKDVYFTDDYGSWGIENGDWCGISAVKNNASCFSAALGIPCCSSKNAEIYLSDIKGNWGIENGDWCGISAAKVNNSCFSVALGFPCCSSSATEVFSDSNGSWGVEYGEWCGISKAKTSSKKVKVKTVTKKVKSKKN